MGGDGSGDPVGEVLAPLDAGGSAAYLGEPVTQIEHALQAATLAERSGAPPALVVAALLHDAGWLLGARDRGHARRGAAHLARWLGPAVSEPVRLHVEAKRWLCATSRTYHALLSEASRRTLVLQGGPMDAGERDAFEAGPWAEAAVDLRRWDDGAKVPGRAVAPLDHWRPLVAGLVDIPEPVAPLNGSVDPVAPRARRGGP